jgi:hypothetical protein
MFHPAESAVVELAIPPQNISGTATDGDWISLKNYRRCTVILQQGAWAGGTPAVTLEQAKTVNGDSAKALSFTERWQQVGLTGTGFTKSAVSSDTFNLPNTANTTTVLVVDAEDLDIAGGFDCIRCRVASPGANNDLLSVQYILSGPRYGSAVPLPDPKVN